MARLPLNGIQAARETVAEAQAALSPSLVNADEHVPQVMPVVFTEWKLIEEDQDGIMVKRRELVGQRTARIWNYVPSEVFDAFMDVMERLNQNEQAKG